MRLWISWFLQLLFVDTVEMLSLRLRFFELAWNKATPGEICINYLKLRKKSFNVATLQWTGLNESTWMDRPRWMSIPMCLCRSGPLSSLLYHDICYDYGSTVDPIRRRQLEQGGRRTISVPKENDLQPRLQKQQWHQRKQNVKEYFKLWKTISYCERVFQICERVFQIAKEYSRL